MPPGLLNRDRMAVPLMPPPFDKRRVARRPRTAASGSGYSGDGELGMGVPSAYGGPDVLPTGSTMYSRNRNLSMGGPGAPQSTAWGADDGQGSDTDLEDEGFRAAADRSHLQTNKVIYTAACRRYGVLPSSQVLSCLASETIDLTNRNLGPKDATALACSLLNNADVTTLILKGNRIGPTGIRSICGMMDENVYIASLDVSDNNLGRTGAAELGTMLQVNEELRELNVAGNNFTEKDVVFIAEALQINFRLHELNLSHNKLQEEGGVLMGKALTTTDTLFKLDLSWNHLRLRGALAVASGLQNNSCLTHLNLSWNGFADVGARAICDALKENTILVDLDLTSNRITAVGAESLAQGLGANNTLQILKLGLNPLSSVGAIKILEAIRQNETSSIKMLDLKEVSVTFGFEALVSEIRKSRDVTVSRGVIVSSHDHFASLTASPPGELMIEDPLHLFLAHVKLKKLRLWDQFANFDENVTLKVTRSQFIQGAQAIRIPLTHKQLEEIVEQLDKKNEDAIDYGQLLDVKSEPVLKARKQIALAKLRNALNKSHQTSGSDVQQPSLPLRPLTGGTPLIDYHNPPPDARPASSGPSVPPGSSTMPTVNTENQQAL